MPNEILYTESSGEENNNMVYVKPPDERIIIKFDASLYPNHGIWSSGKKMFKELLLPRGYPESVSEDYSNYQFWDTLQAFCSTISGTITTQSILKGLGVGVSTAHSAGAAVTWILKDGTGMLARILFAWISSSRLDAESKKWRLFADFLNDVALAVELLVLPIFPEHTIYFLCLSTSMKALVGVAGGATRGAVQQHQAIANNMADVLAKDSSQETCVNLLASMYGIYFLSTVSNLSVHWLFFSFATIFHMYANYMAVRSLVFRTFNCERFLITIQEFLDTKSVLSPKQTNALESVILGQGLSDRAVCGYKIQLGSSLSNLTKSNNMSVFKMKFFVHMYKAKKYMLLIGTKKRCIYVMLDNSIEVKDIMEAYFQAILLGMALSKHNDKNSRFQSLSQSFLKKKLNLSENLTEEELKANLENIMSIHQSGMEAFPSLLKLLKDKGWNLDTHNFNVGPWRGCWGNTLALFLDNTDESHSRKPHYA